MTTTGPADDPRVRARVYEARYRQAHREERLAYGRAYKREHRDQTRAAYAEAHREEAEARIARRAAENDEIRRQRAARKASQVGPRRKGLDRPGVEALHVRQMRRCAICGTRGEPFGQRGLVVDHDHETGATRGIVCRTCNMGLAAVDRHGPVWMTKALLYVSNPPANERGGRR